MTIEIKKELTFEDLLNECWMGAQDTLKTIVEHEKEEEFMFFLAEVIACNEELPTMTYINDLLWFEEDFIFENIGIYEDEE